MPLLQPKRTIQGLIIWACLLVMVGVNSSQAQNLVPNNSFETFTTCPTGFSQLPNATPWGWTPGSSSSSDYIRVCGGATVSVPANTFGTQTAATGSGYAGFYTGFPPGSLANYREYVQVQLTSPLVAGSTYTVSFKWSLGDNSAYATDRLGVYLSAVQATGSGIFQPINVVPQVANPLGNFLNDKINWVTLSDTYVATGGEQYIVIGNFYNNTNTTLQILSGSIAGSYIYVDDVVVEIATTSLNIAGDSAICIGDSTTLTFTGGDTIISWVDSANTANILSTIDSVTVSPLVTTTYIAYGINDTDTFTVQVVPLPNVSLGNDTTICQGTNVVLDATLAGASYSWQNSSFSPTFAAATTGQYWVEVTDSNGCVNSDSAIVTVTPLPVFSLGNDTTLCQGESFQLNATLAGASAYSWQDASTGATYNVSSANTYWVDVTANECTDRDSIQVSYTPLPIVDIGNNTVICANESTNITATAAGATYNWSTGSTASTISISAPATYWVEVTINNCTSTDSMVLDTMAIPVFNLGPDAILCPGEIITLDATTPLTTYSWQDGSTGSFYPAVFPGTYWVDVASYNCVARDSFVLTNFVPPPLDLGGDLEGCEGDPIAISASTPGALTYEWTDSFTDPVFIATTSGTYTVTITDANNCKTTDELDVTVHAYPIVDLGSNTSVCPGDDWELNVALPGATYAWSDGTSEASAAFTPPDSMWVEVTVNNCTTRDKIIVDNYTPPTVDLGNDPILCPDLVLPLDASGPNLIEFLWQDSSKNAAFDITAPGTYWVRVKDQNCYNTDTLHANYHVIPEIDLGNDTVICIGETIVLDATVKDEVYYQWQDGSMFSVLLVEERGNYHVAVEHECDIIRDSIFVDKCNCSVYVPNAFTPNDDKINEQFRVYSDCVYTDYRLRIFDRWGKLVFISGDPDETWDGFVDGRPAQNGMYTWKLFYETEFLGKQSREERMGRVTVIR